MTGDSVFGDSRPAILGPSVLSPGYGVDLPDQCRSVDGIARAALLCACIEPVEAASTSKLGNMGYAPRLHAPHRQQHRQAASAAGCG